jgi:NAD(P)-dependent dehydrogenase (short-subunit alcohol dehydrogenase family)
MARYSLSGKVALVTGGARGIGFHTARALAARGASVVIVDLEQQAADEAASRIDPANAIGIAADVTDRSAMQRAVAQAVERFGGLDVAVANAGIAPTVATFRAMATESFERVIDVNLMGVVRTVDAALPQILARRGHLVLVASIYAFTNGVGATPYAMSKAAVEQLGRALRVELVPHGASASVAYFGFINTHMVHNSIDNDSVAERMLATLPNVLIKRLSPDVAGEAIARGIQRRQARIIRPRSWVPMSVLRGILNPLTDAHLERDANVQGLLEQIDSRAGQSQPTTA